MYDNIKGSSFLPTQSAARTHAPYGTGISLERVAGGAYYSGRTFCIIHLTSGDHDGQHPERHITITQDNHMQIINDLKDTMAQAAVWYKTNVVDSLL